MSQNTFKMQYQKLLHVSPPPILGWIKIMHFFVTDQGNDDEDDLDEDEIPVESKSI